MLRIATTDDEPFLWEMLGWASSPDGPPRHRDEMEADAELRRYLAGWGRAGDVGLVAVDPADPSRRLGATWYRTFTAEEPGYGFVDEATPELAIACIPEARGRGLGHDLVSALLARAHADGLAQLALSVRVTNAPALRTYEDLGFGTVRMEDDGLHATMVAPTRPEPAPGERVVVRDLAPGDPVRAELPASAWGDVVARLGELVDVTDLAAIVAEVGGRPAGLLTWRHAPASDEVEVVGVEAWVRDRGVGAALLRAVRTRARALDVRRLWLITNNDNVEALRFYQRRGWDLVALHHGAADRSRVVKPQLPVVGQHSIPVRHELELELRLRP